MRLAVMRCALAAACATGPLLFGCMAAAPRALAESAAVPDDSVPLYRFSEAQLDAFLRSGRAPGASAAERAVSIGRRNLGQPYEIYLLGEFPYEPYDVDPLYCLSRSDCLTFAEHVYAMALSRDWWSFLAALQRIRYRAGEVSMLARNHYTIADWNRNNDFLFEDLTDRLAGGEASAPLYYLCRRARFFKQFDIGQDIPDEPIHDRYIPKGNVPRVLGELRDGDFVNIIRGDEAAQWCGHTGLIAIGDGGAVNFLHSARPAVREQPLLEYVEGDKRCLGIKILRLRPDAESRMAAALRAPDAATPIDADALNAAVRASPLARGPAAGLAGKDWKYAMRLQAYRLTTDTPPDAALQDELVALDAQVRGELGIDPALRAFGVVDLAAQRFAALAPDEEFYGASVPKIGIVLAYLAQDPQRALHLDPQTLRELQLVIKRSDNELAAKYSQLVGLDAIQKLLESPPYQFYDREKGGGIWCGKHYGIDAPRVGDPLKDHSHAVTVRQCLRYYLLLEQGRLVNPEVSAVLREIFAGPGLEFHDQSFVRGLNGRDVGILRKSGTWEDWHLDTARVQHGDRTYLIAGATQHPRGEEYLARMAAGIDELLCGTSLPLPPRHVKLDGAAGGAAAPVRWVAGAPGQRPVELRCRAAQPATFESAVIDAAIPFDEAVLSWNLDVPAGCGAEIEVRVGRGREEFWSPWLFVGDWGATDAAAPRMTEFGGGRIDVDYFRGTERFDRVQYRVRATSVAGPADQTVRVQRFSLCLSDLSGVPDFAARGAAPADEQASQPARTLRVPYFSQKRQSAEIAGRICSPTSVAMVMAYRGVERPVAEVAAACFDPRNDIYGNWPRNVQAAYAFGVPGYLTRITAWSDAEALLAAGQPLVASVRVAEPGTLRNAPYRTTAGHLIVITGFDDSGGVTVNDPAAPNATRGQTTYSRADLEKCWMGATGGLAYVLLASAGASQVARAELY